MFRRLNYCLLNHFRMLLTMDLVPFCAESQVSILADFISAVVNV
jgi:hypothetical protein